MIIILDTNIIETYYSIKLFSNKDSKLQVTECFNNNIFKVLKAILSNNGYDFKLIIPDVVML
jgi:hypothetical protein